MIYAVVGHLLGPWLSWVKGNPKWCGLNIELLLLDVDLLNNGFGLGRVV